MCLWPWLDRGDRGDVDATALPFTELRRAGKRKNLRRSERTEDSALSHWAPLRSPKFPARCQQDCLLGLQYSQARSKTAAMPWPRRAQGRPIRSEGNGSGAHFRAHAKVLWG